MNAPFRIVLAAAVLAAASMAQADGSGLELRGGYFDMTNASRSAQALFGQRGGPLVGVALRVGLGENNFVRIGASFVRQTGERVIADGEDVFPLGHPLEVQILPAYLDLARQFLRDSALRPYVGFGVGAVLFREESEVAGETLSDERAKLSTRILLGATWGRGTWRLGAELAYSRAPDAIGLGGVSKVYGENDLGGLSGVATLTWRP